MIWKYRNSVLLTFITSVMATLFGSYATTLSKTILAPVLSSTVSSGTISLMEFSLCKYIYFKISLGILNVPKFQDFLQLWCNVSGLKNLWNRSSIRIEQVNLFFRPFQTVFATS